MTDKLEAAAKAVLKWHDDLGGTRTDDRIEALRAALDEPAPETARQEAARVLGKVFDDAHAEYATETAIERRPVEEIAKGVVNRWREQTPTVRFAHPDGLRLDEFIADALRAERGSK